MKLVEASDGSPHNHFLKLGQVSSIHNVLYALNKPTEGAVNITYSENALTILENYKLTTSKSKKNKEVDFSQLNDIANLYSKTKTYFSKLETILIKHNVNSQDQIPYSQKLFTLYTDELFSTKKISSRGILFFGDLFQDINRKSSKIFSKIDIAPDMTVLTALDKIMTIYGNALNDDKDVESVFKVHEQLAFKKGIKYTSYINQIGFSLEKGESPSFKQVILTSEYFKKDN